MTRQLVFVHGRSQQDKDATELKSTWVTTLRKTLENIGLDLPIADSDIHFPYYGDTLDDLASGIDEADAARIVIKGTETDDARRIFMQAVLDEVLERSGITAAQLEDAAGSDILAKGPTDWEWLQGLLRAIDRYVPGASAASVAIATNDVYQYLYSPAIRNIIDSGVQGAIQPGAESVVVSHSLGTVVAYNVLKKGNASKGWSVPLFMTLGSPLGINAIKSAVRPIRHPQCASRWFNAMDERDVVALYPLTSKHFDVSPAAIDNKTDVDNQSPNHHNIKGYLSDPDVARQIRAAL